MIAILSHLIRPNSIYFTFHFIGKYVCISGVEQQNRFPRLGHATLVTKLYVHIRKRNRTLDLIKYSVSGFHTSILQWIVYIYILLYSAEPPDISVTFYYVKTMPGPGLRVTSDKYYLSGQA